MGRGRHTNAELSPRERFYLLEEAAARLGVEVRQERFRPDDDLPHPKSGLVRLGRRRVVILDKDQPLAARTAALAEALKRLDHEAVFLPPAVRDMLES